MRNSQDFIISSKALYPSFMFVSFFGWWSIRQKGDAGSVFAMILEIPDSLSISQEVHQPSRDYTPFGIWQTQSDHFRSTIAGHEFWLHCYWQLTTVMWTSHFVPSFIGACCWDTIVRQSVIKTLEIGFWIGDFQSHRILKLPRTCVLNMSS